MTPAPRNSFYGRRMALTSPVVVIRAENLNDTLSEIHSWLDREHIEPAVFKTTVRREGLGLEISFKSEQEADRFQRQFPWLVETD